MFGEQQYTNPVAYIQIKPICGKREQQRALTHINRSGHDHALDLETTALEPRDGDISLIQISGPTGTYIFDVLKTGINHLVTKLTGKRWIVFNAKFEGRWLNAAGAYPDLLDAGMMHKTLEGGGPLNLAGLIRKELGRDMDKEQQVSDWSRRPLSAEQLHYAAKDASELYEAYAEMRKRMTPEHWQALWLLNDLWRPVNEMEQTGILLDKKGHKALIADWTQRRDDALAYMVEATDGDITNFNSRQQVSEYFKDILKKRPHALAAWPKTPSGRDLSLTRDAIEMIMGYMPEPIRDFLGEYLDYAYYSKYLSSFGAPLLNKCDAFGAIKAQFMIGQAVTGRFSCRQPNLQQVPKSPLVRASFKARPGKVLVCADYSSIEVRTLAELAKDEHLLEQAIYGDPHTATAQKIHGREKITKEERGDAKATGFGIIYGSGAAGLAGRLRVDTATAASYIEGWADSYPEAFDYRFKIEREVRNTGYVNLQSGRSIQVGRKASLTKCANYPVQGAAADAIHAAAIILHANLTSLRESEAVHPLHTRLLLIVHDELIVECLPKDAETVSHMVEAAMIEGWQKIFPNSDIHGLVDPGVGRTWAEAKPD